MKHANNLLLIIALIMIYFISCGNNVKETSINDEYMLMSAPAEAEEERSFAPIDDTKQTSSATIRFTPPVGFPNFIATRAASSQYDDGIHKFIRTAKMKFKVKDIPQATHVIEDIIIKNKGFIIKSAINNNPITNTVNISKDSALVIYHNNLTTNLELRVPHQILDSTLRQIAPLATIIDYRTVEAQDVTIQLMSDRMKQERLAKKQQRMSHTIGTRSGKLDDAMTAEEVLDSAMEEADLTKLSEYRMNDNIAYSSIYIDLYQDETEHAEMILRKVDKYITYQPGFGTKIIDALSGGWFVICTIILFLVGIWPIYIILGIAAYLYFRFKKKENH